MNKCAGIGYYDVATINKIQLDHSIDGMIQGDDWRWRSKDCLRRQLDQEGVMQYMYERKYSAMKAMLLSLMFSYKVWKTVQDYRRVFLDKHGCVTRESTIFCDHLSGQQLFLLQMKTPLTCEIINVYVNSTSGDALGYLMFSKHFHRITQHQ
jgi:hypothetical protein